MTHARKPLTGKIFMHGRSQAVRLPKDCRLDGTEVRISHLGNKLLLEPVTPQRFDIASWRARLRAMGAAEFLPEGRPEEPAMPADLPSFD
jgi:antitoxin VapB